jgi:hypothetical protein
LWTRAPQAARRFPEASMTREAFLPQGFLPKFVLTANLFIQLTTRGGSMRLDADPTKPTELKLLIRAIPR